MTQCKGMNCGTTTGNHSPECRAEYAAAVAGGRFVKNPTTQPMTTELVSEIAARHSSALRGPAGSWDFAFPGYMDIYSFALDLLDTIAPPAASGQKLMELLADARDYVVAFEKDSTDGHIASYLLGKIDAVLVDFYASDSATASDKEGA